MLWLYCRFLSSSKLDADAMTSNLLSNMHCLETCEPAVYNNVLQQSLKHHAIVVPVLHNQVSFVHSLKAVGSIRSILNKKDGFVALSVG